LNKDIFMVRLLGWVGCHAALLYFSYTKGSLENSARGWVGRDHIYAKISLVLNVTATIKAPFAHTVARRFGWSAWDAAVRLAKVKVSFPVFAAAQTFARVAMLSGR
jgi:hypothetical protein